MKQSDMRAPGRGGGGSAWAPRAEPAEEPDEPAVPQVTLEGLNVALPVAFVADEESMKGLYERVKSTVYAAVRDGTLQAVEDMMSDAGVTDGEDEQPPAGAGPPPEQNGGD